MSKILLVEDDSTITDVLSIFLRKEGFGVDSVSGQLEATEMLSLNEYELVLLDVSLSNGNGFALCRYIKEKHDIPVIFLTASGDEYSIEAGFNIGADDYVAKPFKPRELMSRIKHALKVSGGMGSGQIEFCGLEIDTHKASVTKDGKDLFLSALEYRLLLIFVNNKGTVLSRNRLMNEIWDIAGDFVNDNTLTVYIKRLREKIESDSQNPMIIKTVRGLGYKAGE